MRKLNLLHLAAIILISSLIGASCKKPVHSNNPAPNNSRLSSYTKISTITNNAMGLTTPSTINENYRFYYDAANRLIQIVFTSNDSFNIHKKMDFIYSNDTVFKTTTNILTNVVVEKDTLIYNSLGQLVTAYTPHLVTGFQYFNRLLTTYSMSAHNDSGMSIANSSTYTSDNGDILAHNYDGNLTATLPANRLAPFRIEWAQYYPTTIPGLYIFSTPTKHHNTGYTDVLTNYNEAPYLLSIIDTNNKVDSLAFPGALWRKESYHFYTEMANRPGDYMQLQSFTMYGYNVYQNKHLVESISSQNRHANISYSIDAFSNITQTKVVTVDSILNNYTYTYDLQYETF